MIQNENLTNNYETNIPDQMSRIPSVVNAS